MERWEQMKINLEASTIEPLRYFARPAEDKLTEIWREAEILRPGTYKGHEFTEADVRAVIDTFDPKERPLVQVEHNMSLERTHGWVIGAQLVQEGAVPVALVLLHIVGAWAVERVLDGRLSALSAGLDPATWRLEEVSFVRRGAVPTAKLLTAEGTDEEQFQRMRAAVLGRGRGR
jgi:hypothetical protein